MSKSILCWCIGALFLIVGVLDTVPLSARANSGWIVDSFSDESGAVGQTALVADRYGGTHLFWTQGEAGNGAINYAYRPLGGEWHWTDVIVGNVSVPAVAIDDGDFLNLTWAAGGELLFTRVALEHAMDVRSWPEPSILVMAQQLGTSFTYDLVVGPDGILHLPYTVRNSSESSVHYLRSSDRGASWEEMVLYIPESQEVAVDGPQMVVAGNQTLNLIWHLRPYPLHYGGAGVYYSRSSDGGTTWTTPYRIDKQSPDAPELGAWLASIAAIGEQELHVVWDANALSGRRYHQWSKDGGQTWSSPEPVMGTLVAQTGFNPMVLDSGGVLHLFASGTMRWEDPAGVYQSQWTQSGWTNLTVVDQTPNDSPHYLDAVISGGNTLYVAWKGQDIVRCASFQTDTPLQVEPLPLPTPHLSPPTPIPVSIATSIVPATDTLLLSAPVSDVLAAGNKALSTIAIGVVSSLLIVIAVVWIFVFRRRN